MPKPKLILHKPKEEVRHLEAFQYYYSLGDDRSLNLVSKQLQIGLITVKRWSIKFEWQKRIIDLENIVKDKLQKEFVNDIVKQKKENLKIVIALLNLAKQQINDKKLKPKDISDIDKLLKLHALLTGDPTERNQNEILVKREIINGKEQSSPDNISPETA